LKPFAAGGAARKAKSGVHPAAERKGRRKWTPEETEAFEAAVAKHGEGNWAVINKLYGDKFPERTNVQLKVGWYAGWCSRGNLMILQDKWRNIQKQNAPEPGEDSEDSEPQAKEQVILDEVEVPCDEDDDDDDDDADLMG
jgi:hypothetical protein